MGWGESQDQSRTPGRSWLEKHGLKALYPLEQWFSAFEKE